MVSIPGCHPGDPGSSPGLGASLFFIMVFVPFCVFGGRYLFIFLPNAPTQPNPSPPFLLLLQSLHPMQQRGFQIVLVLLIKNYSFVHSQVDSGEHVSHLHIPRGGGGGDQLRPKQIGTCVRPNPFGVCLETGDAEGSVDQVAEWSKALDSGSSPKGRGFEPHPDHHNFFFSLAPFFVLFSFSFFLPPPPPPAPPPPFNLPLLTLPFYYFCCPCLPACLWRALFPS